MHYIRQKFGGGKISKSAFVQFSCTLSSVKSYKSSFDRFNPISSKKILIMELLNVKVLCK